MSLFKPDRATVGFNDDISFKTLSGEFEGYLADWDLLPEPEVDPAPRRVPGTPKYDDWD